MYCDSHAHLDDEKFDSDRSELIDKLKDDGISYLINVGTCAKSSAESVALAESENFIYAAVGLHPLYAGEAKQFDLDAIERLVSHDKVVAIGEIGLDYHYDNHDKDKQKLWFEKQVKLANKLSLPVCIHCRDAMGDCMEAVRRLRPQGVFHCFSGSAEMARQIVKLGMFISFSGVLTYKNARQLLEVAEETPLERILIETDSPYLAPEPFRGKRNCPLYVREVARKLAEIKGICLDEVMQRTVNNLKVLFKKIK